MVLSPAQNAHFQAQGFFLIPNPIQEEEMRQIGRLDQDLEKKWRTTEWPKGMKPLACRFMMLGELILKIVERPEFIEMATCLLHCDRVHIGACGMGDASEIVSMDGRPRQQVQWHSDGGPEEKQVSFRIALDRHDPTNAPLRILPGSHCRPLDAVREELLQLELATGQHESLPKFSFARHPQEVEVVLDPRWALVWSPSCWHATGVKTGAGPRRAFGWNYYPPGGRARDVAALKYIFAAEWENWHGERKSLWALIP